MGLVRGLPKLPATEVSLGIIVFVNDDCSDEIVQQRSEKENSRSERQLTISGRKNTRPYMGLLTDEKGTR